MDILEVNTGDEELWEEVKNDELSNIEVRDDEISNDLL